MAGDVRTLTVYRLIFSEFAKGGSLMAGDAMFMTITMTILGQFSRVSIKFKISYWQVQKKLMVMVMVMV